MSLIKGGRRCRPLGVRDLVWSSEKGLGGYDRVKTFSGKSCISISRCLPAYDVPPTILRISTTDEVMFRIQRQDSF